jgi:hypothetical protein|tara:strand:+ start:30 stop:1418 length:1389 start_codon:yes stop_codon:yes gene_type:complete
MDFKKIIFLLISISICSCSEDTDITVPRNLQEYIDEISNVEEKAIFAYAANAPSNTSLAYIVYYPEEGASDIRYYELTAATLDKTIFANYRRQSLVSTDVYGGKLQRFSRSGSLENWCLVTYVIQGVLRISEPIKLNNTSKSTVYSSDVSINYTTTIAPNFTWEDGARDESVLYFQVISDEEEVFISGTYTEDTFFQYYDETVDNINIAMPKDLVEDEVYNFSMMGIDADNWAQIILEEEFIPRNLEEYVAINSDKEKDTLLAFAGNANGNKNTTYIYFLPKETAFEYRYYETEDTLVDPTDFANYKRQNLIDTPQFGGKFRRFSNASLDAVWCLVTYIADGKLHISPPIKTKNETRTTVWSTNIEPTYPEVLKPVFTWSDTSFEESVSYLQVFTENDDVFLSGTFTAENTFQYYNEANIISKIHTETPPSLVIDDTYTFYVYGLSADNWVNFIIQKSFIAE